MALGKQSTLGLGLILSGAFALAVGCGSDDEAVHLRDAGGEAGATPGGAADGGRAQGGSSANAAGDKASPGGAGAGEGAVGGTGRGGTGEGGTATDPGSAGGGSPPTADGGEPGVSACDPAGDVSNVSINSENFYRVCRGGVGRVGFRAASTDQQFVCCGSSDTNGYVVTARGLNDNDGGGELMFTVPESAPLGNQTLQLACLSGPVASLVAIEVTSDAPPVVDSVTPTVGAGGDISIVGSNLLTVDRMLVIPVDASGEQYYCNVNTQTATGEKVTCKLSGGAPAGQYRLSAFAAYCGALNSPTFDVVEP